MTDYVIETKDLSVYYGHHRGILDVDLRVKKGEVFENEQQAGDLLVLLAAALIAFGLAVLFFQRRSLTVGAWPWQRGKIPARSYS